MHYQIQCNIRYSSAISDTAVQYQILQCNIRYSSAISDTSSSIELTTYNLTNNILTSPDNKLFVGELIPDLTKPCDCVQCDILLEKLEYYSINGKAGDLIKSHLNNRCQRLTINNEYCKNSSDWDEVQQGGSQGSLLSPLFFLLYINSLPYIISNISIFADNTSIIFYNSDSISCASEFIVIFDKINVWFAISSLSLSLSQLIMWTLQHISFKN